MVGGTSPVYRYGTPEAAHQAHFIAAPLLTAAALGLAGVVGGAPNEFKWPGWTLLLLVITAMLLILSIQLGYFAVQFKFECSDVEEDFRIHGTALDATRINSIVLTARETYAKYIERAMTCFNFGTLMLGLGIAAALMPPPCTNQADSRTAAAVLVLVCTVFDGLWMLYERSKT